MKRPPDRQMSTDIDIASLSPPSVSTILWFRDTQGVQGGPNSILLKGNWKLHYPNEIGENRYRCLRVLFNKKLNVENRISISIVVSEIQSGFRKSAFWKTICKYLCVENFEFL